MLTAYLACTSWVLLSALLISTCIAHINAVPFVTSLCLFMPVAIVYACVASRGHCPKCGDHIFIEKMTKKHHKAHKRRFLNYWASVVIDIILVKEFTCMYCGKQTQLSELQ